MDKSLSLPGLLMLPTLLGATDSWVKALSIVLSGALLMTAFGSGMQLLRPHLPANRQDLASLLLAATLGSCLWLAVQAWSYELHQQLGLYLALLPLQCLALEHAGFFQRTDRIRLAAGLCSTLIMLGALREVLGSGALGSHLGWLAGLAGEDRGWVLLPDGGLRLLTLAPGGFILLGLLLAAKRAWLLNRSPSRK
ncbi:Rnf-Nqr domain containing protein [Pseudomonas sessilinigenes]|uniref:NADH:quinone oxidoreductase n=1 Tax=Pseudomonas sessilinigenes TaxID=658629 RepID=A0ABX8MLQ4_9PSED|nr:Rnf-Nqr domain containing protein [Pseudomonas sessilinigenes]AZC26423.1 Electron transport complex protein RnfE [Pseudomonas sessilinigenes]QXH39567.1 NADH:quinone oxidoreductase [Pseudomonas sessilinigenes]